MNKITTSALTLSISIGLGMLMKSQAEDIDVLLFSAEAGSVSIDVSQTSTYLNEMLLQTAGYAGSSCTSYSQSGVNSLVEAIHDPSYRNNTITQVTGNYQYVVLIPSSLTHSGLPVSVKEYPEMVFEASYQLSGPILNSGARPILLMGDPESQANASLVGENTYRIANGCGISANPAGYAVADQNLAGTSNPTNLKKQAYLVASSLYSQITGFNAADLAYSPVSASQTLANAAMANLQTHQSATHYTTSVHNSGMIRYRYLDLNAAPMNGTARFFRKGSSTELKIKNRLVNILEASGFIAYPKRTSDTAGGTKSWMVDDFDLAKSEFDLSPNGWFLCYARNSSYAIAPMIAYNQSNVMGLTYDKQYDGMPDDDAATTPWTLANLHSRIYDMAYDYSNYQWSTVPLHVGIARFYEADPSLVVSKDGTHLTPELSYLGASMMGASSLGQSLTPPTDLNAKESMGFQIGAQLLKQLAYLSEDETFIPDSQLAIQPPPIPDATTNFNYTHTLTSTGGTAPYAWEEISETGPPTGLALSSAGVLSGTPTGNAGTYRLVFKVTDSQGSIRKLPMALELLQGVALMPLLHWKLDDGAGMTATAATGTSIDGALVNAPEWSDYGVDQGSLSFDGIAQKVFADLSAQSITAYSIAFWAKSSATGQNVYAGVVSHDAASQDFQIDMGGSNGQFQYRGSQTSTIGNAPVNEWVHLAVTCDGIDTKLYYNGGLVNTLTGVADNAFVEVLLGVNRTDNRFFKGSVDDFRLYPGELAAGEINDLYQSYPTPLQDPWLTWQLSHFTQNEIDTGVAADDQDPDADGILNQLEYALNLDPKGHRSSGGEPGHNGLPALDVSESAPVALIYRRNLAATDVSYIVEKSDNLSVGSWSAALVTDTILSDDGQTQVIQAMLLSTFTNQIFIRLKVNN